MAARGVSFTNEQIIKALQETQGMVYLAAKVLKCDPTTISKRAQKSPAIKAAIESSRGQLIDVAEVALMAAVQAKQPWAIAFTLKTIGKGRGYVERTEQDVRMGWREEAQAAGVDPDRVMAAVQKQIKSGDDET